MGFANVYARVAARQLRLCFSRDMQYRAHFVARTLSWLMFTGMYLAFIEILLRRVGSIGGWDRHEMYVLYGTYMLLDGIAQVWIQPNVRELNGLVNRGNLDMALTRPIDAQFIVSTGRWDFMGLGGCLVGLAVVGVSLPHTGAVGAGDIAGYAFAVACAVLVLYSCWFSSCMLVFWTQRIDGVSYVFAPFFQFCRYPMAAYPRFMRGLFRTVLPMAFVANVPAEVLLGPGSGWRLPQCALAAVVSLTVCRLIWRISLGRYASASS